MYTFKYEDENVVVEVKTKEKVVTLDALLNTFEDFLRASGFNWIDSIEHIQSLKDESIEQSAQMKIDFPPVSFPPISARGLEQE